MTKSQLWHYVQNQFETQTRNSHKKMNILANDHVSGLKSQQGDLFFDGLIKFIYPSLNKFSDLFTERDINRGIYSGQTIIIERLFAELVSEKLPDWSGKIQAVFHKNTSEYQVIFPDGLSFFSRATYEERITGLKTLSKALKRYNQFTDLQGAVDKFYENILYHRDLQQKFERLVKVSSSNLKDAHKELADALYYNLAMLMSKFYKDPVKVMDYFELEHIQTKSTKEEIEEEEEPAIPLNLDGTVMELN